MGYGIAVHRQTRKHSHMIDAFVLPAGVILRLFHSRRRLLLENLALRQHSRHLNEGVPDRDSQPSISSSELCLKVLVRMETNSYRGGPGDRCALAQIGIRALLARDLQGSASGRQEEGFQRSTGSILRMVTENRTGGAPRRILLHKASAA